MIPSTVGVSHCDAQHGPLPTHSYFAQWSPFSDVHGPFGPRPTEIWNAYRRKDTDAFVGAIERYLEQAVSNGPQCGKREDIPQRIADLRQLIEEAEAASATLEGNMPNRKTGLDYVAIRVLSVVNTIL
jgi:hypothetical protein